MKWSGKRESKFRLHPLKVVVRVRGEAANADAECNPSVHLVNVIFAFHFCFGQKSAARKGLFLSH